MRFVIAVSGPRGTTSGRTSSACGATNVSTIASRPHTSTGPPFERLYAVEPAGVAQIRPSHGCTPSSSPPIACPSSTIRPSVAPATTTSFTATLRRAPHVDLERRQLDGLIVAGEHTGEAVLEPVGRDRRQEPDAAVVDADHRDPGAVEARERAEHRAVAAEHDGDVGAGGRVLVEHELDVRGPRDRLEALDRRCDRRRTSHA